MKTIVSAKSDPALRKPGNYWKNVKIQDIGEHFQIVETVPIKEAANSKTTVIPELKIKNRFLQGKSQFFLFDVKPKVTVVKKRKKVQVNQQLILSKDEKREFALSLKKNIEDVTSLFLKDVLPITLSLHTAVSRLSDYTEQLVKDSEIMIPLQFMKEQSIIATQLVITRRLARKFGLTNDEAKYLYARFGPK